MNRFCTKGFRRGRRKSLRQWDDFWPGQHFATQFNDRCSAYLFYDGNVGSCQLRKSFLEPHGI
jgi:hypothetical protein